MEPLRDCAVERRSNRRVLSRRFGGGHCRCRGGKLTFRQCDFAVGVIHFALRSGAARHQRANTRLSQTCLLQPQVCRFDSGGVHRRLRTQRGEFESDDHFAALDGIADVLRDLRDACRLWRDDAEFGAGKCARPRRLR